ncbi:MAG: transcription termination/antitermination factor NusG [Lachnospiraceae bacterium]|nr:transcription termination/antitermination factor NusG [Lachnospiraceae bacterium]
METEARAGEEKVVSPEARWYVVHTYSGYEKKVKTDIEQTIENRNLQDVILEVSVPMETVIEYKDGVRKQSEKKLFPGYVLVHMVMTDDTWYVIRNTRGVTGFVGPGSKPVPLTDDEMRPLGILKGAELRIDLAVGDQILVIAGPWKDTVAAVRSINENKQSLTIHVEIFGRETPVELNFTDVKKL